MHVSLRPLIGSGPPPAGGGALGVRWSDEAIAIVREAAARGMSPIGLVAYAPPPRDGLAAAREAGASELVLPLHGARAEVHDWHAEPGSFDATLRAIGAARALGFTTAVTTTLTRSNARVLTEMPSLLKASGVSLWLVTTASASAPDPTRPGLTPPDFPRLVPRLGLGLPPALAALARARELGLEARIHGAPECALGPLAALALPAASRAYAPVCDGCAARARCPGVDLAYLERFGHGELRALGAMVATIAAPPIASLAVSALPGEASGPIRTG